MVSISSYEHSRRLHAQPWFQFVSEFIQKDDRVFLKIGHIIEEIPIGSQEDTWQLLYRDERIHVLHPIAHLLSYK